MNVPEFDIVQLTDVQVSVYWDPIVTDQHTGAVPILSYSLEWDQAADNWVSLHGSDTNSLDLFFLASNGVQEGLVHQFRLRAKNQYGWGPYSLLAQIIPCREPEEMAAATTIIDNNYVKISWTAPISNGAEITTYRVLLLVEDNLQWLESEFCLYTDPTLLEKMSCYVPMTELTGSRF